jgi:hypothetical protein
MKPGDLIEWTFTDGKPVREDEMIWSTVEKKHVPIGSDLIHLCVSREGEIITWLNERGMFRAHVGDNLVWTDGWAVLLAIPRPRG